MILSWQLLSITKMSNSNQSQGYLLVNGKEDVIDMNDAAFGVDYRAFNGKSCLLYSALPTGVNLHDTEGKLQRLNPSKPFPATFTDSNSQSIGVLEDIKPNQRMLARKLPMYPELMEVVVYEPAINQDPNMPETGDGIKIMQKGYVTAESVQPLAKAKGVFKPMSGPIFPNDSLTQDIKQYHFGDCFLLASLLAILAKPNGENVIRSMMIQDGDSTIVRLYHPETKEPHYIRVQNTSYHVYTAWAHRFMTILSAKKIIIAIKHHGCTLSKKHTLALHMTEIIFVLIRRLRKCLAAVVIVALHSRF